MMKKLLRLITGLITAFFLFGGTLQSQNCNTTNNGVYEVTKCASVSNVPFGGADVNYTYTVKNISGAAIYYVSHYDDKIAKLTYGSGMTTIYSDWDPLHLYPIRKLDPNQTATWTATQKITQTTKNTAAFNFATAYSLGLLGINYSGETSLNAAVTVTVAAAAVSCNTLWYSSEEYNNSYFVGPGTIGTLNTTTAVATQRIDIDDKIAGTTLQGSAAMAVNVKNPNEIFFIPRDRITTNSVFGGLYKYTISPETVTEVASAANTPDALRLGSAPDGSIWTIDASGRAWQWTATGGWVSKGTVSLPAGYSWSSLASGDLTFDGNGTMYLIVSSNQSATTITPYLFTITWAELNDGSPAATLVGSMGSNSFNGIAFLEDGTLYATAITGNTTTGLYRVNILTGQATLIKTISGAFVTDLGSCALPKPEIQVTKTSTPDRTLITGDTITYKITVCNLGNIVATNTYLVDAIPNGTSYIPGSTYLNSIKVTDPSPGISPYATKRYINSLGSEPGRIARNGCAEVIFKVKVTTTDGQVCNQARVTYGGFPTEYLSDNPALPGAADQTCNIVKPVYSISGAVFIDNDGGTPDGTPYSAQNIYANLLAPDSTVIASVLLSGSGTYQFTKLSPMGYMVQISSVMGVVGAKQPAQTLPGTYVNSSSTDAVTPLDGQTPIQITNANVTGINFGIQTGPIAVNDSNLGNVPGATVSANILSNDSDPGGSLDPTRVSLVPPANASGITTDAQGDITGFTVYDDPANPTTPTGSWSVDPTTGVATYTPAAGYPSLAPVPVNYTVLDNLGAISNQASITITYTGAIALIGNVFNDNNGFADGMVNGTYEGLPEPLYATLVDGSNNIIRVVPVVNGSYVFNDVAGNTSYSIVLTTNPIGSATSDLPGEWFSTGENIGTGAGNDGTVDGILKVTVATSAIADLNFGINLPPVADPYVSDTQVNPGNSVSVNVPSSWFNGQDPNGGMITQTTFTTYPDQATSITIDGVIYTAATWPSGGVTVPSDIHGSPLVPIAVDPVDGAVSVVISFNVTGEAGGISNTATVTIPFKTLSISGTLRNDNNGMVNGVTGTNVDMAGVTVVLSDALGNEIATTTTDLDGNYHFNGLIPGAYEISVSAPAGYFNVSGTDGSPGDGKTSVTLADTNVVAVDFGINLPPVADNKANVALSPNGMTAPELLKPDSSNPFTQNYDPTLNLTGTDPNGGSIVIYSILNLPHYGDLYLVSGDTLVKITDVAQVSGLSIRQMQNIYYQTDPTKPGASGQLEDVFLYTLTDNAGLISNTATYKIPFTQALPVELVDFMGYPVENSVRLTWRVATETAFSHFEIERNSAGNRFERIGRKEATGSNSVYTFDDASAQKGNNRYRLRMVDLDGSATYSNILTIVFERGQNRIGVYPTIANGENTIEGLSGGELIRIYNASGQLILEKTALSVKESFNILNQPAGIYHVMVIKDEVNLYSGKVIKD